MNMPMEVEGAVSDVWLQKSDHLQSAEHTLLNLNIRRRVESLLEPAASPSISA